MECAGPLCRIGDCCEIVDAGGRRYAGEVIGFRGQRVLAMPLEGIEGIRHGDAVIGLGQAPDFLLARDSSAECWMPSEILWMMRDHFM